jgi:hypothetical protein
MKIRIASYKKAQVFKKDYVRLNGEFLRFKKSGSNTNHKFITVDINEGDSLDARASEYCPGVTRWTAVSCQSWSKLKVQDGKLTALNYDDQEVNLPHWVEVLA